MKYKISNKTSNTCIITLMPENDIEKKLFTMKEEQFTFQVHYQNALEKLIHPDATFLLVLNDSTYPSPVLVKYELAIGIR